MPLARLNRLLLAAALAAPALCCASPAPAQETRETGGDAANVSSGEQGSLF